MLIIDPVADMLTQVRNNLAVKKASVILPYSKFKHNLAVLLQQQGWLANVEALDSAPMQGKKKPYKELKLQLKYDESGTPAILGLKRISRPGQRIYAKASELKRYRLGIGATIISTSKGLMTSGQAKKSKLGGEVICHIW